MTGDLRPMAAVHDGDRTTFVHTFPPSGSLLVRLLPCESQASVKADGEPVAAPVRVRERWTEIQRLHDPVPVTLSEPNALLLDQAAWRLNDEPWQPVEELLRLDNAVRQRLGLAPREGHIAQPWVEPADEQVLGRLSLKFTIRSEVAVRGAELALEELHRTAIELDGEPVPSTPTGWFVDESIARVALPDVSPGEHTLELTIDYTRRTKVEWCYLLGDFGVRLAGRHARLVAPVRELALGDWTTQGLPFYTGNVTYHTTIAGGRGELAVQLPKVRCTLATATLDGKAVGHLALPPYRLRLGELSGGDHRLDLTAFGHRFNAFGCVHHTDEDLHWVGPDAWRSTGEAWSYEYQLKSMGLLVAPRVLRREG